MYRISITLPKVDGLIITEHSVVSSPFNRFPGMNSFSVF
jgi:hypothetical protein